MQIDRLEARVKALEAENKVLRNKNNFLIENLSKLIEKETNDRTEKILSPFFSKTQIKAITSKKKVSEWSNDDIASAFTLRSLSTKCYRYLRTKKGYPLPCETTLKERAKQFYCEPGVLLSVITLLQAKGETLTQVERLAVLSIDEMSIRKEWSLDKGKDVLYKPYENVQVAMLRGLVGKWKQPIYFQFDQADMHQVILDIISRLEKIGYAVVAIVHDLGPSNLRLWKQLNIDPVSDKVSFKNPSADRDVFVFADVPHLMKLVRNNLIDSGFFLNNGDYISVASIREMVMKTKSEYGLAYKISELHLNVKDQQRQRVKLAVQLLSRTCASSVKYLGEQGLLQCQNWKETLEFLFLMDEWFDILNSCQMYREMDKSNAFGIGIEKQISTLHSD